MFHVYIILKTSKAYHRTGLKSRFLSIVLGLWYLYSTASSTLPIDLCMAWPHSYHEAFIIQVSAQTLPLQ